MRINAPLKALQHAISMPELPDVLDNQSLAEWDYKRACGKLEALGLPVHVSGQRVLDVGCGLGGMTLYYAVQGAQWVVGMDASRERANVAQRLADGHTAGDRVQIVVGDAARMPFCANAFDRIMSTDAWEHLHSPALALRECARVVRPGEMVAINALPYYSPWGAHTWNWLPLPWLQVILPKRALLRLVSWIEQRKQVNARLPSAVRQEWTRPDDPAHARRLTVAAFERSLLAGEMEVLRFVVFSVGARYGRVVALLAKTLARLPVLRELLAGTVVATMRKPLPANKHVCPSARHIF